MASRTKLKCDTYVHIMVDDKEKVQNFSTLVVDVDNCLRLLELLGENFQKGKTYPVYK